MEYRHTFLKRYYKSVDEVLLYYSLINKKLVEEFLDELRVVQEKIIKNPLINTTRYKNVRRKNMIRFPYCIFYIVVEGEIVFNTFIHQHRDPKNWP